MTEEKINLLAKEAKNAISGALTPEEAYQRFMAKAGKGMMQVMADALASITAQAVESNEDTPYKGWQNYITGCSIDMNFGSPSFGTVWISSAPNNKAVPSTKLQASVQPEIAPEVLGGSITIGGSWSF